jgi:transposase
VTKEYREWCPEQAYLLPPSPTEWLPEGHLAYLVLEAVRELDLGGIERAIQGKDHRGTRPYSPRMMTTLLLYAYCTGVFSSRRIERATYEDVAFRVIAANEHPHFTTVNGFRLQHREALSELFVQVLQLCKRAGLMKLGHVALDGTKVQANASKHKAMSYGRMNEEEKRLMAEIEGLLFQADDVDGREDELHGTSKRGDELPDELRFREERLRRLREAKKALEEEAKESRAAELRGVAAKQREKSEVAANDAERRRAATRAAKYEGKAASLSNDDSHDDGDDQDGGDGGAGADNDLPKHRVQATSEGKPSGSAQRNFTDPDSRIMVRNGVFVQAYNAHAAVNEHQVVLAHALTNQPPDAEHLVPVLERVRTNCDANPEVLTADSGYISERNVDYCALSKIDAYIAVGRKDDAAKLGRMPASSVQMMKSDMREKLDSPEGRKLYAMRKTIVEPVFGQIKQAMGFRRFSLRGLGKARAEWGIVCLCHNLLKLLRHRSRPTLATA